MVLTKQKFINEIKFLVLDTYLHTLNRTIHVNMTNELAYELSSLGWVDDNACRQQSTSKCCHATLCFNNTQ